TPTTVLPTGPVQFLEGSNIFGVGVLGPNGTATFQTSTLTPGPHPLTVYFAGDSNFAASTSPVLTVAVNPSSTTTTLTASPNPASLGQTVTFTASVRPGGTAAGVGIP